jgi:hypothetical protein
MVVFMHATRSGSLVRVLAVAGLVWLLMLAALGLSDYATRGPGVQPAAVSFTPVAKRARSS